MTKTLREPTTTESSFVCPHCNSYASQAWYEVFASRCVDENGSVDNAIPALVTAERLAELEEELKGCLPNSPSYRDTHNALEYGYKCIEGEVFLNPREQTNYNSRRSPNMHFSECYACKKISVWRLDSLMYPMHELDINPNPDLDPEIISLFNEAKSIVNNSPKGAAALLRLGLQLLCKQLGKDGENINRNIKELVADGLDPRVQKALDVLRIVGNESVHPGEINLNDNKDLTYQLFNLINVICEQMISHPKKLNEMYNSLPTAKLEGIVDRDK